MAIVIWNPDAQSDTTARIRALKRPDLIVLCGDSGNACPDGDVDRLRSSRDGIALQQAMEIARREGATHILWINGGYDTADQAIDQLIHSAGVHPDSILIGSQATASSALVGRMAGSQRWARFWLRVQTGRRLSAPLKGLRAYPLAVLDHIKRHQRGPAVHTELLVKAMWAEVPLLEIDLAVPPRSEETGHRARYNLFQAIYLLVLNIHWSMRSVVPIPHRKIVSCADRPGEKISVLRPLRSLRSLLSENVTPERLAASGALGVLLGALPLIACHTMAILFASNYFRLNKVAALSASQLCMPPIVPALCIELGYFMRHGSFLTEISLETIGYQALERLYEWFLGSLVLAPLLALAVGGLILILSRTLSKNMARTAA